MESIVKLVLAAFELVEAEGRMLREQLVRIAMAMALGILIILLALTGLGFLLFSLFQFLAASSSLSPAGAAAVFGTIALLLAIAGGLGVKALLSSGDPHDSTNHQ
ncbi:hypothetical protein BH10PLA1_BH10PLA1_14640 [soil metagenome]